MTLRYGHTPVIRKEDLRVDEPVNSECTRYQWGPEGASAYLQQTYGTLNPDNKVRAIIEHPDYIPPKGRVKA